MTDEQKLARNIANVMEMWMDWYVMSPMSMTDEELLECMAGHYSNLREEMIKIAGEL